MNVIAKAYNLIKRHIYNTPVLYSPELSKIFNNNVFLKLDSLQHTGAFKIRGVLNFLLSKKQTGNLPSKVVAYSTGNHAIAVAYAAKILNISARVYLPRYISQTKKNIVKNLSNVEIIETTSRSEAEFYTQKDAKQEFVAIPPSDNDEVIAGAGTMCYEALLKLQSKHISTQAIFAPCGGGGLLAGSYLAKEYISPESKIYGVEPSEADDAYKSVQNKSIFRFSQTPMTIADGLRALNVSQRTLNYLTKLDNIYLVEEEEIRYWNNYLNNIIPAPSELSATISLAAAKRWSENNESGQNILILISGGNIDKL